MDLLTPEHFIFLFLAMVSVVSNFKMSLYMELSTKIHGKWIAVLIILLSSAICLGPSTYCYLTGDWWKCFQNSHLRTAQILLGVTLLSCLLIISDITTQKLKRKTQTVISGDPETARTSPAVIQINNFFPCQDGDQNGSSDVDHVR